MTLPAEKDALRQGLIGQLAIGALLCLTMMLGAPLLAAAKGDARATPLFRVAGVVLFCYALYAALVGALNGRQAFTQQAGLDIGYTTLRSIGVLAAAALGYGALGAFIGFASAALCVLAIALFVVGTGRGGRAHAWRPWWGFMAPLVAYHICLNLILQFDLFLVTSNVTHMQLAAGASQDVASATGNAFAGYYRAAQTFAFVPYQLILSVAFVVFPMISEAVALGDEEATRSYIRAAMRFSLIVLFAIAGPVAGASDGVMLIAYPAEYLAGAPALALLSIGMVCFALFAVAATILSGAGRPQLAALIAAVTAILLTGFNILFVRAAGVSEHTLLAAAAATSLATALAMLVAGFAVHRRFGAFIGAATTARVLGAAAIAACTAWAIPHHTRALSLIALVAGGLIYLAALWLLREVDRDDLARLASIGRRQGG